MTDQSITHKAISASAGSGKTFQLIRRYIGILCHDVAPEKIIAMTFTRKAAGEIFDGIVGVLCKAAEHEKGAEEVTHELHACSAVPAEFNLTCEKARSLLHGLLAKMHLCRIGTLDSFFVSIVQAFPFEFGFGGEINLLEGHPAMVAREETLRDILLRKTDKNDGSSDFLESFKQATYGQESKNVSQALDDFTRKHHKTFMEAPSADYWGNEKSVWPYGCPWFQRRGDELSQDLERMRKLVEGMGFSGKTLTKWELFLGAFEDNYHPEGSWMEIKDIFDKLAGSVTDLAEGTATLKFGRSEEWDMSEEACGCAYRLLQHVMAENLKLKLERTRGIYGLLKTYEDRYSNKVRNQGNITFDDIDFLLNDSTLSQQREIYEGGDEIDRMYIDYRLDSHHDHWLLDEFQDTSITQWRAIENLVDEVLQDNSGQRSFFYVGDVKQAIYRWRGGEPKLFDAILQNYNSGSPEEDQRIKTAQLSCSWRSSKPVIDTVNKVFDNLADRGLDIPPEVLDRWEKHWEHHKTARTSYPGYAAMYSMPKAKQSDENKRKRNIVATEIIREVQPLQRGLSVGALVRTNKDGLELVKHLQSEGIPASFEGAFKLLDNNFTVTLSSLVKIAQHPGDTFAHQHLRMSPLTDYIPTGWQDYACFVKRLNRELHYRGFERFLNGWIRVFEEGLSDFEKNRAQQLLTAAREFDASEPRRRATDFLDFLEDYELSSPNTGQAIQVMTVHKAKGLQFDMVILPAMDRGSGITSVGSLELYLKRSDDIMRRPEWILEMPMKAVAQTDEVLAETLQNEEIDSAYEELCNLYVAVTRPKHALYMIRTEPGKSSKAIYPSTIAGRGLQRGDREKCMFGEHEADLIYAAGDPEWYNKVEREAPDRQHAPEPSPVSFTPRARFVPRTPSSSRAGTVKASALFKTNTSDALAQGTALHILFSRIEWWQPGIDADSIIKQAVEDGALSSSAASAVRDKFRDALKEPGIRKALSKPSESAECWREYPFEIILKKEWVSGCFDRVVLEKDADSDKFIRGKIVDFKTNRIDSEDELQEAVNTYRPQLNLYKRVLSRMVNIPANAISTSLLFTYCGRIVPVDS